MAMHMPYYYIHNVLQKRNKCCCSTIVRKQQFAFRYHYYPPAYFQWTCCVNNCEALDLEPDWWFRKTGDVQLSIRKICHYESERAMFKVIRPLTHPISSASSSHSAPYLQAPHLGCFLWTSGPDPSYSANK